MDRCVVDIGEAVYGPMSERVAKAAQLKLGGEIRPLVPSPTMLVRYVVKDAGDVPVREWLLRVARISEAIMAQGELVSGEWVRAGGWYGGWGNDYAFVARYETTEEDDISNEERDRDVYDEIRTEFDIEREEITETEEEER